MTTNLLSVLSQNGRLPSVAAVLSDFFLLTKAHKGELEVIVTSAEALDAATLSRIEKALKSAEATKGKQMKVVNKVNDAILGGLLVEVGDKTIDLSASSKINKLNGLLTGESP